MSDLFANPLEEMIEFQDLKTDLQRGQGPLLVTGCLDSQKVHLLSELSDLTPWKLIVTYDDSRAREICEDYRCFDTDISLYPARDLLFYTSDIHGNLLTKQRIQVMRRVLESSGGGGHDDRRADGTSAAACVDERAESHDRGRRCGRGREADARPGRNGI